MPNFVSERAIPLHWPAAWTDTRLLTLLKGTPVNCLLEAPPAIAEAARANDMMCATRAEAAAGIQFLPRPLWPGVRPRRADSMEAGPTGSAWVNANSWAIRLAQAQTPGKPVWVEAVPGSGVVQSDASYLLAVAESSVYNARWVVALDAAFAGGLASGDPVMKERWHKMMTAVGFFEARRPWAMFAPRANLVVISSFTRSFDKEVLNLADRRNLSYRIVLQDAAARGIADTQAVLYLDRQPPNPELSATLKKLVHGGALLIAPVASGMQEWGEAAIESPIPNYNSKSYGNGRIAVAQKPWQDPYVLAAEARVLIGRRLDVLRVFNAGSMSALYARAKDGSKGVIHLLNYTLNTAAHPVSVAPVENYATAQVVGLDRPAEAVKVPAASKRFPEIPVSPFAVYSAVELLGSREGGRHA